VSYQDPTSKHDHPRLLLDREWWPLDEPVLRCTEKTLTRWQRFTMAIRKIVGRTL